MNVKRCAVLGLIVLCLLVGAEGSPPAEVDALASPGAEGAYWDAWSITAKVTWTDLNGQKYKETQYNTLLTHSSSIPAQLLLLDQYQNLGWCGEAIMSDQFACFRGSSEDGTFTTVGFAKIDGRKNTITGKQTGWHSSGLYMECTFKGYLSHQVWLPW